jgi:hypothetical protein
VAPGKNPTSVLELPKSTHFHPSTVSLRSSKTPWIWVLLKNLENGEEHSFKLIIALKWANDD